jgi:hypothetical protein
MSQLCGLLDNSSHPDKLCLPMTDDAKGSTAARGSTRLVACLVLLFSATIARAQYAPGSAIHPDRRVSPANLRPAPGDTAPVRGAVAIRGVTALLGYIPGAVVGGMVAGNTLPRSQCHCDDPGLKEIEIGPVVGGAFGAAVGAAAPGLRTHCSGAHRFWLGLLGSVVGTGVGMLAPSDGPREFTVPIFSITGAALAEWPC